MELEKGAIKDTFSQRDLLIRVKQALSAKSKKAKANIEKESMNYRLKRPLLRLNTYQLKQKFSLDSEHSVPHLDLGFSIFTEQRLRLRGLDAPELGTSSGLTTKRFVESRLKDCKFLIIKTYGSDKYDRYMVDVFYLKVEFNEDKVLRDGIFLNNDLIWEISVY